jgi:hypothetical protein
MAFSSSPDSLSKSSSSSEDSTVSGTSGSESEDSTATAGAGCLGFHHSPGGLLFLGSLLSARGEMEVD